MARRYRARRDQNLVIFVGLILLVGLFLPWVNAADVSAVFTNILCIVLAIGIIAGTFLLCRWIVIHFTRQRRALHFASLHAHDVDHMSGKEFEIFLDHLLNSRGFSVKGIYHGNDGGVDIVAKKDKETYSIQAKRYNTKKKVDRRAITDAVAGIKYKNCTKAMAITNSYFTKAAREYGDKTECILVDRDVLAMWVYELGIIQDSLYNPYNHR